MMKTVAKMVDFLCFGKIFSPFLTLLISVSTKKMLTTSTNKKSFRIMFHYTMKYRLNKVKLFSLFPKVLLEFDLLNKKYRISN